MKDNFSNHASDYAKFRPTYPQELIQHIATLAPAHGLAWDCATGNGQVASMLSDYFAEVIATDISEKQLQQAVQKPNIRYRIEQAEKSSLEDNAADLIVVAQAVHWFEFDRFYSEVQRVLKPGGVIAILGYGLLQTTAALQPVVEKLYEEILGNYWDSERRYLDEAYQTIPFPFEELDGPNFNMRYNWTYTDLIGYLNTWSAAKHYEKANGTNPVTLIEQELQQNWGEQERVEINFRVLTRIGKV